MLEQMAQALRVSEQALQTLKLSVAYEEGQLGGTNIGLCCRKRQCRVAQQWRWKTMTHRGVQKKGRSSRRRRVTHNKNERTMVILDELERALTWIR